MDVDVWRVVEGVIRSYIQMAASRRSLYHQGWRERARHRDLAAMGRDQ